VERKLIQSSRKSVLHNQVKQLPGHFNDCPAFRRLVYRTNQRHGVARLPAVNQQGRIATQGDNHVFNLLLMPLKADLIGRSGGRCWKRSSDTR
jgi:hypothetical protein